MMIFLLYLPGAIFNPARLQCDITGSCSDNSGTSKTPIYLIPSIVFVCIFLCLIIFIIIMYCSFKCSKKQYDSYDDPNLTLSHHFLSFVLSCQSQCIKVLPLPEMVMSTIIVLFAEVSLVPP